jgi:hypothetical protein
LQRVGEDLRNESLQIEIDVGVERRRAHRIELTVRYLAQHTVSRVHFDETTPLSAAEFPLVLLLQSLFADLLSGLVALILR